MRRVRCAKCYRPIRTNQFDHEISGDCRAAPPPRAPTKRRSKVAPYDEVA